MRFPRATIAGAIAIAACALAYTYTAAAEPFQRLHNENGVPMILTATGKSTHYRESTACLVAGAHALFGPQLKQLKQVNVNLDIALRKKETVNCVCGDNPNRNRMKVICDSETGAECSELLCEATVQAEVWARDRDKRERSSVTGSSGASGGTNSTQLSGNEAAQSGEPRVRRTQSLLAQLGYDPGPIDGIVGNRTKRALEAFHRDHPRPVQSGRPLGAEDLAHLETVASQRAKAATANTSPQQPQPEGQGAELGEGQGRYNDGKKHGHWIERFPDGRVEEGEYDGVFGTRKGHWTVRLPDGCEAEADYGNGKEPDVWAMRCPNGTVGEGPIVDGKQHGQWTFRYPDGRVVEGPIVDGKIFVYEGSQSPTLQPPVPRQSVQECRRRCDADCRAAAGIRPGQFVSPQQAARHDACRRNCVRHCR